MLLLVYLLFHAIDIPFLHVLNIKRSVFYVSLDKSSSLQIIKRADLQLLSFYFCMHIETISSTCADKYIPILLFVNWAKHAALYNQRQEVLHGEGALGKQVLQEDIDHPTLLLPDLQQLTGQLPKRALTRM